MSRLTLALHLALSDLLVKVLLVLLVFLLTSSTIFSIYMYDEKKITTPSGTLPHSSATKIWTTYLFVNVSA